MSKKYSVQKSKQIQDLKKNYIDAVEKFYLGKKVSTTQPPLGKTMSNFNNSQGNGKMYNQTVQESDQSSYVAKQTKSRGTYFLYPTSWLSRFIIPNEFQREDTQEFGEESYILKQFPNEWLT
ncbi:UNKNOWN [Stylonychia lemnae]|uniref:Uncharacterized protein n=1 Tax=Stylonychia lemnae TaxID=5949 RepID=A0A077ZUK8_STYLE|nr:UNKNOWN [Stylonychia lemnae]|eukprot:CDW73583.1 UNKNOWN [Stylonychia lemnae]